MAKWLCPCGNQIRFSGAIPNPQEWHLLSDTESQLSVPFTLTRASMEEMAHHGSMDGARAAAGCWM
jgi:hypothetical protein